MQRHVALIMAVLSLFSFTAKADAGGSAELIDGRLKIQFSVPSDQSKGSFQLRSLLEKSGFANKDGFVRTDQALSPLEIYNYLYSDGRYVFTIFLPAKDKFFVSFDEKGFVSFGGTAAQRLFDLIKLIVPRNDVNNLEQYKWTEHSYCDRKISGPTEFRCWIER